MNQSFNKSLSSQPTLMPLIQMMPPAITQQLEHHRQQTEYVNQITFQAINAASVLHGYTMYKMITTLTEATMLKQIFAAQNNPELEQMLDQLTRLYIGNMFRISTHGYDQIIRELERASPKPQAVGLVQNLLSTLHKLRPDERRALC